SFKYLSGEFLKGISDSDASDNLKKTNADQLHNLRTYVQSSEVQRVEEFVNNYRKTNYWFQPEYSSPGRIFRDAMPRVYETYLQFSGSAHASFIGARLFSDLPDAPTINPSEHPVRTRSAIAAVSRLTIDISWARGSFEGVTNDAEH